MRNISFKPSHPNVVISFLILLELCSNSAAQPPIVVRLTFEATYSIRTEELGVRRQQEFLECGNTSRQLRGSYGCEENAIGSGTVVEILQGQEKDRPPADVLENHRKKITFQSSVDGSNQEAFAIIPPNVDREKTYLVVSLHSWSSDLNQRSDLESLVFKRDWCYLFPNFRGPNQHPDACGSKLAQRDILDAVEHVLKEYSLESSRVFLTGTSGGGHMTMLMAGRYPDRWRAACAWVGISDLVSWHETHRGKRYGNMIEKSCGGSPTDSPLTQGEYYDRSPINFISGASELPIALFAGIHDGHRGSVPIRQSIDAFNVICNTNGDPLVSQSEINQLSNENGRLIQPLEGDEGYSQPLGRKYYLKRSSKSSQLLIFEGGHEGISSGTIDWFERWAK